MNKRAKRRRRQRRADLNRRLLYYATAAGTGAFGFGQAVEGAIIYTDVPDQTVSTPPTGGDVAYMNLNNAGYNEFALAALEFDRSIRIDPYNVGLQDSKVLTSGTYYVFSFASGATIGPASTEADGARFALRSPSPGVYYNFFGTGGYAGLKWDIGGGDFLYGWARIDVSALGGGNGSTATLFSYAYEDVPNTPIAAGAVPEPSTLALLALGGGALALARRRR